MTKTAAVNNTSAGAWFFGNAGGDAFAKGDLQNLGANFEACDHSAGKGLAVARVAAGAVTSLGLSLTSASNFLSGDVALSNTGTYFDGPSMAQGTSGTWLVFGTVTLQDTVAAAHMECKLWDGTTLIASARQTCSVGGSQFFTCALSGIITSPVANVRISVKDATATTGIIKFNATGNSKDSFIWGLRIG